MKFTDAKHVSRACYAMKQADTNRSTNRALINALCNGETPFTAAEQRENSIDTNVNFLAAARLAHDARNTFTNAFLKPGNYFTVTLDSGPVNKKDTWSRIITKNLNRVLKRSLPYTESLRAKFAQTVLHGVGPSNWESKDVWMPTPVSLDDILFPSRTRMSMDNCEHFAIYRQYTPSKLWKMTQTGKVDEGWDVAYAKKLISEAVKEEFGGNTSMACDTPEKVQESIKADSGILDIDSIKTTNCWDHYHLDEKDGKQEWYRSMLPEVPDGQHDDSKFLYKPRRAFASELSHINHIMVADGSSVAPFRYHSTRGLGWMIYGVCHLDNRLKCRFHDSVFQSMLQLFRVSTPEDRQRLDMIDLYNMGVVPEGVNFVKPEERHRIDHNLINQAFAMNRQLMSENSSQFSQNINDGTSKEMTAAETMARVNSANALVGSMLQMSYTYQTHEYLEICRRFCMKNPSNADIKKFQEDCIKEGVPREFLDVERWNVEPERVLGSGNKTLEIAQAKELMGARSLYEPEAQSQILHIFTEALTDDPQMAERLVPSAKKTASSAITEAQQAFGALMWGAPVVKGNGINAIEYTEALLASLGSVISQTQQGEQMGVVATPREIIGFKNVVTHIGAQLNILAQDNGEKERVGRYGAALTQFSNLIKAFEQHAMEKMEAGNQQGGLSAEDQGTIQGKVIMAQANAKIKEAASMQKMEQRQRDFQAAQERKASQHGQDLKQQMDQGVIDRASLDLKTAAEINRKNVETETLQ